MSLQNIAKSNKRNYQHQERKIIKIRNQKEADLDQERRIKSIRNLRKITIKSDIKIGEKAPPQKIRHLQNPEVIVV